MADYIREVEELLESNRDHVLIELPLAVKEYSAARESGADVPVPTLASLSPALSTRLQHLLDEKPFFIRDMLGSRVWPQLMMASFFACAPVESSPLVKTFPVFAQMNSVRRGGNNMYKRDGWGVHVMMGLYISNVCIPDGIAPVTVSDPTGEVEALFNGVLKRSFQKMNEPALLLYRLGTLIHDIGVVDGVEGHPASGVLHVDEALQQLGIDRNWITQTPLADWTLEEVSIALKVFVENHVLPSLVFGEYGVRQLTVVCAKISSSLNVGPNCQSWGHSYLVPSLSLFMLGDAASVRDEYLTAWKIRVTMEAQDFLSTIIGQGRPATDPLSYGALRLREALDATSGEEVAEVVGKVIPGRNLREGFLEDIGRLERMDYAFATLRRLPDPADRVRFLQSVLCVLRESSDWKSADWQELLFDPDLPVDWVIEAIDGRPRNQDLEAGVSITRLGPRCVARLAGVSR